MIGYTPFPPKANWIIMIQNSPVSDNGKLYFLHPFHLSSLWMENNIFPQRERKKNPPGIIDKQDFDVAFRRRKRGTGLRAKRDSQVQTFRLVIQPSNLHGQGLRVTFKDLFGTVRFFYTALPRNRLLTVCRRIPRLFFAHFPVPEKFLLKKPQWSVSVLKGFPGTGKSQWLLPPCR